MNERGLSMAIKTKRIYEQPGRSDGVRVLVDRLWPRGVLKEKAHVDEWMKEIAPSDTLRRWFSHKEARWAEFQKRYSEELQSPQRQVLLRRLRSMARKGTVTLLFAAKDEEYNNVQVLSSLMKQR